MAQGPEPAEVFAAVCAEVGGVLGVRSTNLTRFEADGTQTVVAGWSMPGAPVFPVGPGVPLEGYAAVAKVNRSGHAQRVDDYSTVAGPLSERIRAAGIASSVAAPIKVGGRLWGAVVASSGEANGLPPGTEARVAGFAELVADALAGADAREQLAASRARIVAAGDAERRRLERNLHDGAQQRLVALTLALRGVQLELDRDPAEAHVLLAAVREELAGALEELRELARGIHPANLSEGGLVSALQSLAERTPVFTRISAVPDGRLPEPVEAAAYYLVAEALTNVAKHSGASHASVGVTETGEGIRVVVHDDGRGGAELSKGTGLRGLADRVEALGGRFRLASRPGTGTTLIGEIPLGKPVATPFELGKVLK